MAFGPAFPPAPAGPPETLLRLVSEFWRKLFAEGADIGSSEVLACCLDPNLHPEIELAQSDTEATGDLESANRDAIALGCFGVPWIVADD